MRILVFGPNGMLGSSIMNALRRAGHTGMAAGASTCSYDDQESLARLIDKHQPDRLVNCAGVRSDIREMVRVNSLLPHMLAQAAYGQVPLIHMSIDGVFSGRSVYKYSVDDLPDARDVFGRTKMLGEVPAPGVTNIRTAFIGRDRGFVKDVLEGRITKGQKNVLWSGSTVEAVAYHVARLLTTRDDLPRVIHLATEKSISRYYAASLIMRWAGRDECEIEPGYTVVNNLALLPTVVLPSLEHAIQEWEVASHTTTDIQ